MNIVIIIIIIIIIIIMIMIIMIMIMIIIIIIIIIINYHLFFIIWEYWGPGPVCQIIGGGPGPFGPGESAPMT